MNDYESIVGIYSENNELIEILKYKFNNKDIDVVVFDDSSKTDISKTSYLIINLLDLSTRKSTSYLKELIKDLECKVIVLYPLNVRSENKYVLDGQISELLEFNDNLGVLLVPELLGKNVKYNKNYISHNLIMQSIVSERVKIDNSGVLINTISLSKLAEVVVRQTLSFGISGETLALVGPRRGSKSFASNYLNINSENLLPDISSNNLSELYHSQSLRVPFSLNIAVNATKKSFIHNLAENSNLVKANKFTVKKTRTSLKDFRYKYLFNKLAILILLFLATPIVLVIITLTMIFLSVFAMQNNPNVSKKIISYSSSLASFTRNIKIGIPNFDQYTNLVYRTNFIAKEALSLSETANEFTQKIIGKETYDLVNYADSVSSSLDRIYTEISFFQVELSNLNGFLGRMLSRKYSNSKQKVDVYKNNIYYSKNIASRLSNLLGVDSNKKYLFLFQNNMELRATGGFIGSYALLTLDKGRLVEIVVSDVYTADGQLKGHVAPPEPIRKYLGEGGWYLRDSNWDPDFAESANKAEWFLEKEMGVAVDGVVALDLTFIQNILKITGPIMLADYDQTITAENLYLTTQNEVESNFFPGSIKKASFLTALSKELLYELQNLSKDKYLPLLQEIHRSAEERHLQIFLHDTNAQDSIKGLGYAGELNTNTNCGERCFKDNYSVIDSNFGVNKANYFIERSQDVIVSVNKNTIGHDLFVTYKNSSSQAIGQSGLYKSYTRVIVPEGSAVNFVREYDEAGNFTDLPFEVELSKSRGEIGFLVEVIPTSTKKIRVSWNTNTQRLGLGGEYNLKIRKQAGTESDKLRLRFEKSDLALTGRASSVYTTDLVKDFNLKLFFK